ncbi:J domain-containing protein [Frankia sp. BMG5.11]|uniref:J domain-containing protein n=1 Tax=Parafrankia sp. BMG5.11 TaxID=222540 RepID=UPI00103878A6|nr:J domain-containing protein [Parafrankia sp. BMG5.11]
MRVATHYQTLGVEESAAQQIIRSAYLQLMREIHPDCSRNGLARRSRTSPSEANAAYQILSDRSRRAEYDRRLRAMRYPRFTLPRMEPIPLQRKLLLALLRLFFLRKRAGRDKRMALIWQTYRGAPLIKKGVAQLRSR